MRLALFSWPARSPSEPVTYRRALSVTFLHLPRQRGRWRLFTTGTAVPASASAGMSRHRFRPDRFTAARPSGGVLAGDSRRLRRVRGYLLLSIHRDCDGAAIAAFEEPRRAEQPRRSPHAGRRIPCFALHPERLARCEPRIPRWLPAGLAVVHPARSTRRHGGHRDMPRRQGHPRAAGGAHAAVARPLRPRSLGPSRPGLSALPAPVSRRFPPRSLDASRPA
jgi:hypothetical protein